MTMIAIAGVGPQWVVQRSIRFARAPAVRVDSTAARLIGFPGDQLAQTQLGSTADPSPFYKQIKRRGVNEY